MRSTSSLEPLESRIAPAILISAAPSDTPEGNDSTTEFTFEVKLSEASAEPVSIQFGTEDWTAKANLDYLPQQGLLTFAPGETSKLITIPILGDAVQEPNELFRLHLHSTTGSHVGIPNDGYFDGIIINDDNPQAPRISVSNQTVVERDLTVVNDTSIPQTTTFNLTFQLNEPQPHPVTFTVNVGGTATRGVDYQDEVRDYWSQRIIGTAAEPFTVTFLPNQTYERFSFTVLGDRVHEPDETMIFHLSNPTGAVLLAPQATVVIQDDDPLPAFSIEDSVAIERNYGTDFHPVRIVRSGDTEIQATVYYETIGYTAAAGADFTPVQGDLVFAPGETVQWISLPILGDTGAEADEQFFVVLTNPLVGQPSEDIGRITIQNDDGVVLPEIRVSDSTSIITSEGHRYLDFTVTLSRASTEPVSFAYQTTNGTATAGSDYEPASGEIFIPAGSASTAIRVPLLANEGFEFDETFRLVLSSPHYATLQRSEAAGTIISDTAPHLSISAGVVLEGMPFSRFLLTMDHALPVDVIVNYSTQDYSAYAGTDYQSATGQMLLRAGSTSAIVDVPLLDDGKSEGTETFILRAGIWGLSATTTEQDGDIFDNDLPSGPLRVAPAVGVEGEPLHFTVVLDQVREVPTQVFFGANRVTIPAGQTHVDVMIPTHEDAMVENPEMFTLHFSAEIDGSLVYGQTQGIVLDDDQGLPNDFQINQARTMATWTDGDGDRVTLRVNRHVLDADQFHFITSLTGDLVLHEWDLRFSSGTPRKGCIVSLTAKAGLAGGSGTVDLGRLVTNVDLKSLTVDGTLNSISSDFSSPHISVVRVRTLGAESFSGHGPSLLTLTGSLRLLSVTNDWNQAQLSLVNGNLGVLKIGGDFVGQTPGASPASTLSIEGRIGSISVGGSIAADHGGGHEISFSAESLGRFKVHGNVENAIISAPDLISIAEIVVKGQWEASNLYAGRTRGDNGVFGDQDDLRSNTRLGKFQAGTVIGTEQSLDQFHIYAPSIGTVLVDGRKLPLSKTVRDHLPVPGTNNVTIAEYF